MLYEITTLTAPLLATPAVLEGARGWVTAPGAVGTPLGFWRTEHGALGRTLVLRQFEDPAALVAERRRALLDPTAFAGGVITQLSMEGYAPFPFLPPVTEVLVATVFEFRTYWLKPGGLPPTLAGWEQAIGPARDYTAHLVTALFALDGPPRITHIWGFDSLDQRAELRARHYAAGLWPPKGGPENIHDAISVIALPA